MIKIAILQSNYIPWKGVFDMINQVDKFVFFEDVQFTKRDWRTRNRIKTKDGELLLSVPTKKAPRESKIHEIEISQDVDWQNKHLQNIEHSYSKTPYFEDYYYLLEKIYKEKKWTNLSEFNIYTTKLISKSLGIKTKFYNSKDLKVEGRKDHRLVDICKKLNGDFYLSGPAAKSYINNDNFINAGIDLAYIIYDYPEYAQAHGEFNHYITVLDVLFNCGEEAEKYILQGKYEEAF